MASPAHLTKHLPILEHPLRPIGTLTLRQSDDGVTTGSGLWLGAQVLSAYLLDTHRPRKGTIPTGTRPRAIELGAGIGLTGLVIASLGYDVLATDVPAVLPLLRANISTNTSHLPLDAGRVDVRELDWTVLPAHWRWDEDGTIASPRTVMEGTALPDISAQCPAFDLIVTADTIYRPDLVEPLLRTLHHLAISSTQNGSTPRIFVALERRDPALVESVLTAATTKWGFTFNSIPKRRLSKALEKCGMKWVREDWGDVEIWKFSLSTVSVE